MTQKKKLILGPLPDQADDYTQYEETVIRWDRIIGFALVLILLVIGLVFLLTNDTPTDERVVQNEKGQSLEAQTVEAQTVEGQSTNLETSDKVEEIQLSKPESVKLKSESVSVLSSARLDLQQLEMKPESAGIQETEQLESVPEQDSEQEEVQSKVVVQQAVQSEAGTIQESTSLPSTEIHTSNESDAEKILANVEILSENITEAVLSLDIKNDIPGSPLSYTVSLPEAGIFKVILFTEMKGLRGKTLYHEWYRNGIRQAKVKIPVNVKMQKSYSSKFINYQMLGDWQVKVVDEKDELYILADFRVVHPE